MLIVSSFFSLLFFACDSRVGDPLTANYYMQFVSINTIREGAILVGNSVIPVAFHYDSNMEFFPDKVVVSVLPHLESEKERRAVASTTFFYSKEFDNYYKEGGNPAFTSSPKEAEPLVSLPGVSDKEKKLEKDALESLKGRDGASETSSVSEEKLESYLIDFPLLRQKVGIYQLQIEFFNLNRSLGKREVLFFFAEKEIRIASLEIHPAVAFPGGELLLIPQASGLTKGQGYVRVHFKNRLLYSGSPEKILNEWVLDVPKEEGIYPLLLELFPQPPSEEMGDFAFLSPCFIKSNIFVSEQQTPLAGDFSDRENFLLLHHFRGELKNSALGRSKIDASVNGKPKLSMHQGFFGYNFGNENYLQYDSFLLPLSGSRLQPFSLHLSANFPKEKAMTLFETSTENFRFELRRDSDRLPLALFHYGGKVYRSKVPNFFSPEELVFRPLTISVYPFQEETRLLWYRDGQLLSMDRFPLLFHSISPSSGKSFLGKGKGETGVVDELAIYFQDDEGNPSVDATIFESNIEKKVKKALLFAQGFDSLELPKKDFSYKGKVEINSSSLFLSDRSEAHFDFLSEGVQSLNAAIDLTVKKSQSQVILCGWVEATQSWESLVGFDFVKGVLAFQKQEIPFSIEEEGILLFSLNQNERGELLFNQTVELPFGQLPSKMRLSFFTEQGGNPLSVNAIVVDSLSRRQELIDYRKPLLSSLKK